jgi:hypothetical protein
MPFILRDKLTLTHTWYELVPLVPGPLHPLLFLLRSLSRTVPRVLPFQKRVLFELELTPTAHVVTRLAYPMLAPPPPLSLSAAYSTSAL